MLRYLLDMREPLEKKEKRENKEKKQPVVEMKKSAGG